MSGVPRIARVTRGREWPGGNGFGISVMIGTAYVVAIGAVALTTGLLYHATVYGNLAPQEFVDVAILVAALFLLPAIYRNDLWPHVWLGRGRRRLTRVTIDWVRAFALLLAIGFLTKTSAQYSRAWLVLFFLVGLVALVVLEAALVWGLRAAYRNGRIAPRRIAVIGPGSAVEEFKKRFAESPGLALVAGWTIDDNLLAATRNAACADVARANLDTLLASIREEARQRGVSDIVVLVDSSCDEFIDTAVEAFGLMPVSVHLDAAGLLERFGEIRLERIGPIAVLGLTVQPLGPLQALGKRAFDLVFAGMAVVLLAPLMLLIAIVVKLDSRGPVLFRQRRLGYNQREFKILKFRTMSTLDDGDTIEQARRNDPRVTRVGAFLRRWNLDELPQLFNVLAGDMSIVGPRPHAVAHDRQFEKRVLAYPRRANVMPGITGWAQVNGFRGETDTDDKLRSRVEHDLYYIDNWSLGLDVYIVLLTVLSPKSYRNAA
ncbi:MAG: undecaprenyl-phosphate glucose phosphotransferase [Hyphomicrobiaceae bacterium]